MHPAAGQRFTLTVATPLPLVVPVTIVVVFPSAVIVKLTVLPMTGLPLELSVAETVTLPP
jgi:hypothetical protein